MFKLAITILIKKENRVRQYYLEINLINLKK